MEWRWDWYVPDVSNEELNALISRWPETALHADDVVRRVLQIGTLCRLAFASLLDADGPVPHFHFPPDAIISQTQYGLRRGRPRTARWAFWTAYLLIEELNGQGQGPTLQNLSKLISILLGRQTPSSEVKKILEELRREATRRATAAAQFLLDEKLQQGLSPTDFRERLKSRYSEWLEPTTEFPPIIEHGQVTTAWLAAVMKTRRAILARVHRTGPLAEVRPLVRLASSSPLVTRFPLGGDAGPGGRLHLGKGVEVPTPSRPFAGGTTSIAFPRYVFESPPVAAVLYAVPSYWDRWFGLLAARPQKMSPPESHDRHRIGLKTPSRPKH